VTPGRRGQPTGPGTGLGPGHSGSVRPRSRPAADSEQWPNWASHRLGPVTDWGQSLALTSPSLQRVWGRRCSIPRLVAGGGAECGGGCQCAPVEWVA